MTVGNYSPQSIASYVREMRFIFAYYPDTKPSAITADQVEKYICYLKQTFNSSRDKCRMVAASVSFYYKQILKRPYDLPSKIYPRSEFKLPNVMTSEEVRQLLAKTISIKQAAVVQLFYSTGIRLTECCNLRISDIDSKNMRIKVVQGKGRKDRFTLLSATALDTLRQYFRQHRPVEYLFEGQTKGKQMNRRSIQHCVELVLKQAGLRGKGYNVHTLRHSFATHLLDTGTGLHSIKELLGHSSLRTTMIYLHLQSARCSRIINPLDHLSQTLTGGSKQ